MTLKNYLIIMSITTAFVWGLFLFVINTIDPQTTNWLGFLIFYLALFLAIAGTTTIIGFFIRFQILKKQLIFHAVKTAFRQSFLFASLAVAILYLLAQNLFSWTNLILLVVIISVVEFLMISYQSKKYK